MAWPESHLPGPEYRVDTGDVGLPAGQAKNAGAATTDEEGRVRSLYGRR